MSIVGKKTDSVSRPASATPCRMAFAAMAVCPSGFLLPEIINIFMIAFSFHAYVE
jgi:hypothetical protein